MYHLINNSENFKQIYDNFKKMTLFLILLAAGNSKRLKTSIPKPYQIINNKTLLEHSLDSFKEIKEIKKT